MDITDRMAMGSGRSAKRQEAESDGRLTPTDFAARFQSAWQPLWYIAAAVLGERAGADDVLQEAAMVALSKLSQFDPNSNFTAWMGRIVRFIALNHARRRVKTTAASVDPQSLDAVSPSAAESSQPLLSGKGQLLEGEGNFDDQLLTALQGLEETARACLLLRTLMDMPYKEISLALDIAEGTAMSHVHRARAALRERLSSSTTRPAQSDQTENQSTFRGEPGHG